MCGVNLVEMLHMNPFPLTEAENILKNSDLQIKSYYLEECRTLEALILVSTLVPWHFSQGRRVIEFALKNGRLDMLRYIPRSLFTSEQKERYQSLEFTFEKSLKKYLPGLEEYWCARGL